MKTLPPENVLYPTLEQLYNRVTTLVRNKGYEKRITDNITAAMRTRIGSLMRGWKGHLFNQPVSTPWADLFDRPVVINLQQMGDDADKCFTMALLMNFLYEYRQAQYESAGSPESASCTTWQLSRRPTASCALLTIRPITPIPRPKWGRCLQISLLRSGHTGRG